MQEEGKDTQPQLELAWLARYFYARGFKEKAREIMDRIQPPIDNLIDLEAAAQIDRDEERRA